MMPRLFLTSLFFLSSVNTHVPDIEKYKIILVHSFTNIHKSMIYRYYNLHTSSNLTSALLTVLEVPLTFN
jgi:hypothetical protein